MSRNVFYLCLLLLVLTFSGCASGMIGKLGGKEVTKFRFQQERDKTIKDFLKNQIKVGTTSIKDVENMLGFPSRHLEFQDGRVIWVYEVRNGIWLLLFGTVSTKEYVFQFKDRKLLDFYTKESGRKTGVFVPTAVAEPTM